MINLQAPNDIKKTTASTDSPCCAASHGNQSPKQRHPVLLQPMEHSGSSDRAFGLAHGAIPWPLACLCRWTLSAVAVRAFPGLGSTRRSALRLRGISVLNFGFRGRDQCMPGTAAASAHGSAALTLQGSGNLHLLRLVRFVRLLAGTMPASLREHH